MNNDDSDSIYSIDSLMNDTISLNGTMYDNSSITWNSLDSLTISSSTISNNYDIHATGDVRIDGDLKIQGESIKDLLEEIKDKLAIFKPNIELEERWEILRELRHKYLELEKDILEKEEIVRILKL
jgi:hypothetical protein